MVTHNEFCAVDIHTAINHSEVVFLCRDAFVSGPLEVVGLAGEELGNLI